MAASNYVKTNSLDFWLRRQNVQQPTNIYVALYTNDPTAADTGVEVSGGGYARQPASFSAPTVSGELAIVQNLSAITFPQLSANAGTAAYVGLRDAAEGGHLLYFDPLPVAVQLSQGYTPYWSAGDLKVNCK